jgi:hypothetical protein
VPSIGSRRQQTGIAHGPQCVEKCRVKSFDPRSADHSTIAEVNARQQFHGIRAGDRRYHCRGISTGLPFAERMLTVNKDRERGRQPKHLPDGCGKVRAVLVPKSGRCIERARRQAHGDYDRIPRRTREESAALSRVGSLRRRSGSEHHCDTANRNADAVSHF